MLCRFVIRGVEPKFASLASMVTWKLGLSARNNLLLELDGDKIFFLSDSLKKADVEIV